MRSNDRRRSRDAFTLIELLLVMVILAILAAVVVPKFTGRTEDARIKAAKAEISGVKTSLDSFEVDNGRYPTTEEGLSALINRPGDLQNWHQGLPKMPIDPWGHEYIYRCPGSNGQAIDLFSCGPDGHEGGGDDVEP
ncbi:type II secretion system major pseudopilin GspG [soil metagenome]